MPFKPDQDPDFSPVPVILCGGMGKSLWPLSTPENPKQFLKLLDPDQSLFDMTIARATHLTGCALDACLFVTRDDLSAHILSATHDRAAHLLKEPFAKNTSAAFLYAALYAAEVLKPETVLWYMPSDHYMGNIDCFAGLMEEIGPSIAEDKIVIFGIQPQNAETAYGYIELGKKNAETQNVYDVACFHEKPDYKTAQFYAAQRNMMWNSGMCVAKAETVINAFQKQAPHMLHTMRLAIARNIKNPDASLYKTFDSRPFDRDILEKGDNIRVFKCNPDWCDVGTFQRLALIRNKLGLLPLDVPGDFEEDQASLKALKKFG